jgi:mannose-1-phosphate guanylyltransferase
VAHKYTIEFDEDTWHGLLRHAGRGNIKDYIQHLLEREFQAARTRAVILAGGEEAELYPTKIPIPKAMLPVGYRPVVEYLLERIVDHGINQITIITGQRGNVREHFNGIETPGVDIDVVVESQPGGTAGALRAIRHQVRDTFIVLNGDILTNVNLSAMLRAHRESGAKATVLVTHPAHSKLHDPHRLGWVTMEPDGTITGFQEPDGSSTDHPEHYNAGVYILEASLMDQIPGDGPASIENDLLAGPIAAREVRAWVLHESDYWLDVADPDEFAKAWEDVLTGRYPKQ